MFVLNSWRSALKDSLAFNGMAVDLPMWGESDVISHSSICITQFEIELLLSSLKT